MSLKIKRIDASLFVRPRKANIQYLGTQGGFGLGVGRERLVPSITRSLRLPSLLSIKVSLSFIRR